MEPDEHHCKHPGCNHLGMPADRDTIAVIEDDPNIAQLVEMYLSADGFDVVVAGDASVGLSLVERHSPALVLLDVGLPGDIDGFEVCRRLRAGGDVAVIILTARSDEFDRVMGLELGADDYMTKPFSPREMVARVRSVLRRVAGPDGAARAVVTFGSVEVDGARREVRRGGVPITLARREFDLLAFLVENRGLALTRRQLLDGAWGHDWYGDERTVDVHVRQLRKKVGDDLPLATVRGVGYRLA